MFYLVCLRENVIFPLVLSVFVDSYIQAEYLVSSLFHHYPLHGYLDLFLNKILSKKQQFSIDIFNALQSMLVYDTYN